MNGTVFYAYGGWWIWRDGMRRAEGPFDSAAEAEAALGPMGTAARYD